DRRMGLLESRRAVARARRSGPGRNGGAQGGSCMTTAAHDRVAGMITGCWTTQVIHAAVALGIVDAVEAEGSRADVVAGTLGLHPRATFRLLRAMAALGLCAHGEGDVFTLTEAGRTLRSDAEDSLAALARHWGGRTWTALTGLAETVRTGEPFPDSGREGFLSMKDKPEQAAVFN